MVAFENKTLRKARVLAIFVACLFIVGSSRLPVPGGLTGFSARSRLLPTSFEVLTQNSNTRLAHRDQLDSQIYKESTARLNESYGKLPLILEANHGQADPQVKFLARGSGYTLFLTETEAVFQLPIGDWRLSTERSGFGRQPSEIPSFKSRVFRWLLPDSQLPTNSQPETRNSKLSTVLHMKLVGANNHPQIEGLEPLSSISNYIVGNDRQKWHTNVQTYAKVQYRDVYPGVNLIYYGRQRQLEYDLVVAPGVDPSTIKIAFEGVEKTRIDRRGDLVLLAAGIEIRQQKPRVYQEVEGLKREVSARYVVTGPRQVGFTIGRYDTSKPLIIDPMFVYFKTLGGSLGDTAYGLVLDAEGNAYVTGVTESVNFPTTDGAYRVVASGGPDVFVAKLNAPGTALLYSTYLGGTRRDQGVGISVDSSGSVTVTGYTESADFPTSSNALQMALRGSRDGFITKLNAAGSSLLYSSFLGGSGLDEISSMAVDSAGGIYLTGHTESGDFPISVGALQTTLRGSRDAFIVKLTEVGSSLSYSYSTYLGGTGLDQALGISADASGNAYVTGFTESSDFPTSPAALQAGLRGSRAAFIAKLNMAGTELAYSTYLGGSRVDSGNALAVDSSGNVFVTGTTSSADFPTTPGAYHQTFTQYPPDFFTAKLSQTGSQLIYSTFGIGGSSIAVDSSGNAYVEGTKLDARGSKLLHRRPYVDGEAKAIVLDSFGNRYLAGMLRRYVPGPHPGSGPRPGPPDAFVAKFTDDVVTLFVPIVLSMGGLNNSFYTSELVLTNRGTQDAALHFTYTAAFGGGSGTATDTLPAGQQRIVPDAIGYLRTLGIPIAESGGQGGTLLVRFSGLSSDSDPAVIVRTTTAVSEGRAGLAYRAIATSQALTETAYLCGLRQNAQDRSNVAVQNAGGPEDGDVILRLTVISGSPTAPFSLTLPDERLAPAAFKQFNSILVSHGLSLTNGYVRVERVGGRAPYYAYGVINDEVSSDGSFVEPLPASKILEGPPVPSFPFIADINACSSGERTCYFIHQYVLPVMVETNRFTSELVLTNLSMQRRTLCFDYVADAIQTSTKKAHFAITLNPGEQSVIPNFVQYLRDRGVPGIGSTGPAYAGALFGAVIGGDRGGLFLGARTSTTAPGGRYGVFYPSVLSRISTGWVYGLQQNAENRSNLALINTGELDCTSTQVFRIDIYDGETGLKVRTIEDIRVEPKEWKQISSLLAQYAPEVSQGYALVTKTAGSNPYLVYSVTNDGARPGERTGDGAFIASSP